MATFIKNDFVSMDWLKENFIESKKSGFIAGIQEYTTPKRGDIAVGFMKNRAFILADEEDNIFSREELINAIKETYKDGSEIFDYYEDCYVELGTVNGIDDDMADYYGFDGEDKKDILDRINDLKCYWVYVEEDM